MENEKIKFKQKLNRFFCPVCNKAFRHWHPAINHCRLQKIKYKPHRTNHNHKRQVSKSPLFPAVCDVKRGKVKHE